MQHSQEGCRFDVPTMHEQIAALPLPLDAFQIDQLAQYIKLLLQWNRAFNLTAIRDTDLVIKKHLWDSLMVVHYLKGEYFLDVGSGGGLPGIPLAIYFPHCRFHLVDSAEKKSIFLRLVAYQCRLKNVEVSHARVENLKTLPPSGVLFRAFASLKNVLTLWNKKRDWANSTLYLWKSKRLDQELIEAFEHEVDFNIERINFEQNEQHGVRSLLKLKKK